MRTEGCAYLVSTEHGARIPFDGKAFSHTWNVFQELRGLCSHASATEILTLTRTRMPERMDTLRQCCADEATFLKAMSALNELTLLVQDNVSFLTLEYFTTISAS